MHYDIEIETKSIEEFGQNITVEGNNFLEILNKILKEVEVMEEGFDTRTGKLLKEKLLETIENDKKIINNKYISYTKRINDIVNIYEEVNKEIKQSIQK